jgi:hypothetical protein
MRKKLIIMDIQKIKNTHKELLFFTSVCKHLSYQFAFFYLYVP